MNYNYDDIMEVDTSKYGNGKSLNMREIPSQDGALITTIPNKYPLSCDKEAESNGWLPCYYADSYGFVMAKFVKGTAAYGSTPAGQPGNYDGRSTLNCKATVRGSSLALRASDDLSSKAILYIPENKKIDVNTSFVYITEWLRAVYNNQMGFVKHAYLEVHPSETSYVVAACERYGAALLRKGQANDYVGIFKKDLWDMGWNNMDLNGTFDSAMDKAVREFQAQNGLSVDGVVGNATKERLYKMVQFG